MDDKLKNALEFANYAHTLHNQKKLIEQKFTDSCIFYYNAGKFTITQNLITYCAYRQAQLKHTKDPIILLDDNNIPIIVDDIDKFILNIEKIYNQNLASYYKEYQDLVSSKSVKGLLDE
jgi:hypothetical protein|tara:strand:- start:8441 stop:8797 length:357 start_codon:yes stop_codon:yes gene_type:complete